ncbi:MAG: hypothetical protein Q4C70_08585 [Planctomycetia bacterium]|nr:hypothetical protein [Planctomycetia bacterium]
MSATPSFLTVVHYTPKVLQDGCKPLKMGVKKKIVKNANQAAVWIWRAVKKRIRRATGKKQVIPVEYKLYHWSHRESDWFTLRKSPTDFMRGKHAVAPGQGRGGRERIKDVKDVGFRRWNKASKPGEGPLTHPSDVPGWKDEWMRSNLYYKVTDGTIRVYLDMRNGGKNVKKILTVLEYGGETEINRRWEVGYYISTIRHGYKAQRGGGAYIFGNGNRKNKSGKTRRTHKVRFREPHVALSRKWESWSKKKTIAPRPVWAVCQNAFFETYFPELVYKPE